MNKECMHKFTLPLVPPEPRQSQVGDFPIEKCLLTGVDLNNRNKHFYLCGPECSHYLEKKDDRA